MPLKCPRDGSQLNEGKEHEVEIDRCPQCQGAWYDNEELALLEASVTEDADYRSGMIDYAKRDSELNCPVCDQRMRAFNYRAHNLELDACTNEHGFWLDAGESARVRDVMEERIAGLQRGVTAQQDWNRAKSGKGPGIVERFKGMFKN